jgi:hypothetical protein
MHNNVATLKPSWGFAQSSIFWNIEIDYMLLWVLDLAGIHGERVGFITLVLQQLCETIWVAIHQT